MAIDYDTSVGRVRLLIADINQTVVDETLTDDFLFSDAQIETFLLLEAGNVRLAAAQALDTMASSEAMVSKKIRTLDLQTDGPAVAKELRDRAKTLREQADNIDPDSGEPFAFDVIDFDPNAWLATE